jgi:SAM-dependent methyltransferase
MSDDASENQSSDYYNAYSDTIKHMAKPENYLTLYEKYFAEYTDTKINVLELGIFEGHSLEYFAHMLKEASIFGIDQQPRDREYSTSRIKTYTGSQDDENLHQRILSENNIPSFDIIIDDCSHIGGVTLNSYNALFPKLVPGGLYVIEDWGTGYWPKWPGGHALNLDQHLTVSKGPTTWIRKLLKLDGRYPDEFFPSHFFGIPGMFKQLIDEVGMADATGERGLGTGQLPAIEFINVYQGIAFIKKSDR